MIVANSWEEFHDYSENEFYYLDDGQFNYRQGIPDCDAYIVLSSTPAELELFLCVVVLEGIQCIIVSIPNTSICDTAVFSDNIILEKSQLTLHLASQATQFCFALLKDDDNPGRFKLVVASS
jgi:hypothetical protein